MVYDVLNTIRMYGGRDILQVSFCINSRACSGTHLHTLNQNIDDISNSFEKIKGTFHRIDTQLENLKDSIDHIDELMVQRKNRNPENRPSCIPGFYRTTKPVPPTPPNSPTTSSSGITAIRCKHYR